MPELPVLQPQNPQTEEEPVLVGFRIHATHHGPQFYSVVAMGGDNERPLKVDDRILFFVRPELAAKALLLDETMAHLKLPLENVEMLCDVAEALYLVNSAEADPDGVILDCLHFVDDLVRASKLNMPERYQSVLTEMADHLTKSTDLSRIFSSESLRHHVEDALLWSVGAVTIKATMMTE